jgi:hypothetical protein
LTEPTTFLYVAQGIHGLAYGMILFLIASGLNIIDSESFRFQEYFRAESDPEMQFAIAEQPSCRIFRLK